MNTANLQLEGLYLVLAGLVAELRAKGLLDAADIDRVFDRAEAACAAEAGRMSPANLDAVRFPARLLRAACAGAPAEIPSFSALAARVGTR